MWAEIDPGDVPDRGLERTWSRWGEGRVLVVCAHEE